MFFLNFKSGNQVFSPRGGDIYCDNLWECYLASYTTAILWYTISRGLISIHQHGLATTTVATPLVRTVTQYSNRHSLCSNRPSRVVFVKALFPRGSFCTPMVWFIKHFCEPYHICWPPFSAIICRPPSENNTGCPTVLFDSRFQGSSY